MPYALRNVHTREYVGIAPASSTPNLHNARMYPSAEVANEYRRKDEEVVSVDAEFRRVDTRTK